MIEISQPEEIDIANEIARLEAMYKHYKILYRKFMLLCWANERKVVKHSSIVVAGTSAFFSIGFCAGNFALVILC